MISVFKKYGILRYCLLFVILFFVIYSVLQPTIYALSPEQKKLYDSGIYYYDIGKDNNCQIDNSVPNGATNNKVYIMGDSYSVGIDKTLTKDLKAAGYDVIGKNEDTSGTISKAGDSGVSAMQALDKDKAKIAEAGSMVVLLGTNPGDYAKDIPDFMDKLKTINPDIKVYWMTVGYTNTTDADLEARNKVIKDFATKYNYTIADWYSAYSKDKSLSDGIHPTKEGYKVLSKLFTDAMGNFSAGTNSSTSGSDTYMTTDKTKDNDARIWSFLTSPDGLGLTAIQAAGIMGNFEAESGFDPTIVQGGSHSDTMNINGSTGYGIAQWTSIDRQKGLKAFADKLGKKESDLDVQLNYLKKELTEKSDYKPGFAKLKKATDIVDATYIFHKEFEKSSDSLETVRNGRGGSAKKAYKKFTGQEPVSLGSSSSGGDQCLCTADTSSGTTIFLDPGHGPEKDGIDPTTGIRDHEYLNPKEAKDTWEVATEAKKELEKAGYKVVMSKDSADGGTAQNFRDKSNKANASNAALGISIHTTPGGSGMVWNQFVGGYREGENGKKDTFTDADIAKKSEEYAKKILDARKKNEKENITTDPVDFSGREGLAPGNLPLIMLWSKIPWVYLEKAQDKGVGLSEKGKKEYVKSIVDGVKASVPISGSTGQSSSVTDCVGSGGGTILEVVQQYAWEDGREVQSPAKDAYKEATVKASKEGKYTGQYAIDKLLTDCGGFVTRVMQNSVDPNYNNTKQFKGPTPDQEGYLKATSDLYTALGPQKSTTSLQPGDVAVVNSGSGQGAAGHTFIYTGKINDQWKGNAASASGTKLVPHASNAYFSDERGQYLWFRHK